MGDYAQAEPLLDKPWRFARRWSAKTIPITPPRSATLASLYYSKGDYARAEPIYERALAIRRETLGE